jgi:hypothetical protein
MDAGKLQLSKLTEPGRGRENSGKTEEHSRASGHPVQACAPLQRAQLPAGLCGDACCLEGSRYYINHLAGQPAGGISGHLPLQGEEQ